MEILNLGIYILEVVSTILIIHTVFQSRIRLNFYVFATLFASVSMLFVAYITKIQYITYVAQLAIYIYCLFEFRRFWWETLLRFACSIAIIAVLETMFLMEISSWLQTLNHSIFVYIGISVGMLICAGMLYWFFVYRQISFEIDMSDKTFIVLVVIINVFVLYVKNDGNGRYLRLIICMVSFVLLFARFMMLSKKGHKRLLREEEEWVSSYSKKYEELIHEVRKRQHDYKNELQTIKTVCATGEGADMALQVIGEYEDADQYTGILNGCENPIVAGLIYSKMKEFVKEGIHVTCNVRLRNVGLSLEIRDIVDICGILLDNAFECTKEQEIKSFQFGISETEKGVLIKTNNPSPYVPNAEISKMFTLGYSTKGKNRGIGLYTVRELVKKCHGEIITGNQTAGKINYFDMQILIPFCSKCSGKN